MRTPYFTLSGGTSLGGSLSEESPRMVSVVLKQLVSSTSCCNELRFEISAANRYPCSEQEMVCVYMCVCRESCHWVSWQSFALLQMCFTDQPNTFGLTAFRSECFPSFSRRGLWSVMINAAQLFSLEHRRQLSPQGPVWVCWGCLCGNWTMS